MSEAALAYAPSLAEARSCHALKGHSGARVVYHAVGARGFVRKTAATPAANARLLAQAGKQRQLHRLALPFPRVLAQGVDADGRARFDMEYLPGRSVADAVINAAAFDASALLRTVQRMIWLFAAPCAGAALAGGVFRAKIESIAAACDDAALRRCAARLLACDWEGIPASSCHGDLTLENMLLTTDRSVGLIDCDATFASSWWLDFGKLFQDIEGHWCLRDLYRPDTGVRRINAIQKLEPLATAFRALAAASDPALPARLPQLASLGLLRAAPYAAEPPTIAFICARIEHLLETRP